MQNLLVKMKSKVPKPKPVKTTGSLQVKNVKGLHPSKVGSLNRQHVNATNKLNRVNDKIAYNNGKYSLDITPEQSATIKGAQANVDKVKNRLHKDANVKKGSVVQETNPLKQVSNENLREVDRVLRNYRNSSPSNADFKNNITQKVLANDKSFIGNLEQISKLYPDVKFRKAIKVIKDTANPSYRHAQNMATVIMTGLNTLSASISGALSEVSRSSDRTKRAMFEDYTNAAKEIAVTNKDKVISSSGSDNPLGWL